VKKVIVSASAVAVLVAGLTLAGSARGQNTKGAGAAEADQVPHKVGLIDMAYVFKKYTKFDNLRDGLKAEISKSEEQVKLAAKQLNDLQTKMKTYKEGSEEYKGVEQVLLKKSTEFETFRKSQQREFLRQESQIYKTVYMEVSALVQRYAKTYQYTLIIRFNREDPEASENPQEVMQRMNKQVVYYREDDDITESIVEALNQRYAKKAGATTSGRSANGESGRANTRPTTKQ